MAPRTFRTHLTFLGWKQKDFAKKLGVTQESVSRWANDKAPIPEYVVAYLDAVCSIKRIRDMAQSRPL